MAPEVSGADDFIKVMRPVVGNSKTATAARGSLRPDIFTAAPVHRRTSAVVAVLGGSRDLQVLCSNLAVVKMLFVGKYASAKG